MNTYKVKLEATFYFDEEVEASSEEEALEIAKDLTNTLTGDREWTLEQVELAGYHPHPEDVESERARDEEDRDSDRDSDRDAQDECDMRDDGQRLGPLADLG
jgi:hypothetical protein